MSIYKNKKIIVLFLAPVTIGLLVFVYYPLIQTIIGSLYKWVSYSPDRKWVGIANYLAIFQKKGFLRILLIILYMQSFLSCVRWVWRW